MWGHQGLPLSPCGLSLRQIQLFQPGLCVRGQAVCSRAQTNVYTAGTCVSSVSLLLIVYLLHFPCGQCPPQLQLLVEAAGTTGK